MSVSEELQKIIVLCVVAAVLVGGGLYFYFNQSGDDSEHVACTQEAMICPDGSAVGRTGPNCEFAECPSDILDDAEEVADGLQDHNEVIEDVLDPPVPEPLAACIPVGCSGTICMDEDEYNADPFDTTCEYLPEYACYDGMTCERQVTGECGWTESEEISICEDFLSDFPEDEEACLAAEGLWLNASDFDVYEAYRCYLPASDAGMACADSSECVGICVTESQQDIGAEAVGTCTDYVDEYGDPELLCAQEVKNGVAEAAWCH